MPPFSRVQSSPASFRSAWFPFSFSKQQRQRHRIVMNDTCRSSTFRLDCTYVLNFCITFYQHQTIIWVKSCRYAVVFPPWSQTEAWRVYFEIRNYSVVCLDDDERAFITLYQKNVHELAFWHIEVNRLNNWYANWFKCWNAQQWTFDRKIEFQTRLFHPKKSLLWIYI